MEYIMLCDSANNEVIIKRDGRKSYEYEFGKEDWKRVGILEYFTEDSDKYEKYVSISDDEAARQLDFQRKALNEIWKMICSGKEYKIWCDSEDIIAQDLLDNLEQKIVSVIFEIGMSFYESIKNDIKLIRIKNSLDCLFKNISVANERELIELRTHRNTRLVATKYFANKKCCENSNVAKNEIIVDFLEQRIFSLDDNQKKILFI